MTQEVPEAPMRGLLLAYLPLDRCLVGTLSEMCSEGKKLVLYWADEGQVFIQFSENLK